MTALDRPRGVLALAVLCAGLAGGVFWLDGNVPLFVAVQALSTQLPGLFWQGATLFGDDRMLLALSLPFLLYRPRLFWLLVLSGVLAGLAARGLKIYFDLPRPAAVLPPEALTVIGKRLTRLSFPSGHTVSAFAFATAWLLHTPAARPLWWLGGALLVGVSRMAVGAHWPLDVLSGAAIGMGGALLVARYFPVGAELRLGRATPALYVLATAAVLSLPFNDQGYPETLALRWGACLFCLAGLGYAVWRRRLAAR